MTDIPEMPQDWWPDEVTVTGKKDDIQLSFAITADSFSRVEHEIKADLECLRKSIWTCIHDPEHGKLYR